MTHLSIPIKLDRDQVTVFIYITLGHYKTLLIVNITQSIG